MQQSAASNTGASPALSLFLPPSQPLTIHRRSETHHGLTLRTLGHAAEYLASSRIASMDAREAAANREAVHILMRLSREVFDEFAELHQPRHRITDWLMRQVVRVYGAA